MSIVQKIDHCIPLFALHYGMIIGTFVSERPSSHPVYVIRRYWYSNVSSRIGTGRKRYEYSWLGYCCLGAVGRHGDMNGRLILLSAGHPVPVLAFGMYAVRVFATLIGTECGKHKMCIKYLGLSRVRKFLRSL
jgi:hypothetical protein